MDDEEEQQNSIEHKLKPVSIDKNGEPVYSLEDYLQHGIDELNEDIDEACAVFGECNDVECSYNKGYHKRQALYACHTCIPESKLDVSKAAGVCLACSLHCHNGHDLVELYTKRNFRCDCGNSKFDNLCTLIPDKVALNTANSYNQNFTGLYCTCARPYPDPDDDIEDDMISCALCEDWFHTRHLGVACPASSSYEEMICAACIKKHDFLLCYDGLSMTKVDNTESTVDVNIIDVNDSATKIEEVEAPSDDKKSADTSDDVILIENQDIAVEKEEKGKEAEQGLGDDNLPNESLEENADGSDHDVYEISSEDVEMSLEEPQAILQQERDDICDNLNDISRQCEEIDKAVDDSNKEALASVKESTETELDTVDITDVEENVAKPQESLEESDLIEINEDQSETVEDNPICITKSEEDKEDNPVCINPSEEDTPQEIKLEEGDSKIDDTQDAEEKSTVLEDKDLLNENEPESSSTKQEDTSTVVKKADNIIQEGETKRVCKKPKIKSTQISTKFYESSRWRENLCICADCTKLYSDHNVAYLLDPQDTLQFYKEFGREVYVEGAYGAFKRKLDSLPHSGKIFLAEGMAEFKDKFGEFLKQFADEERVITSEDVRTFFGNLDQSRKRRKIEMESNYYCR